MVHVARLLFALLCVWLAGASLLSLCGLRSRRPPLNYAQPGLDFAVGAAALGAMWVVAALAGISLSFSRILLAVAALGALAAVRSVRRPRAAKLGSPRARWHARAIPAVVVALVLAVCALGVARFSWVEPMFWDGRYIWAFKAKAMFSDGRLDRETFANVARYRYTALDHPPALPALQAWVYQCLGRVDERYGKSVGLIYWLGIGALLAAYLRRRVAWHWALLGSGLTLLLPAFAYYARSGGADVEQGFHLLAAGLLMAEWLQARRREDGILAALMLGTGGLIKPEGLSIALGGAALFLFLTPWRPRRSAVRDMGPIMLALLVPLLPWITLRLYWRIPSLMLTRMRLRPWPELAPRLATIAQETLREMTEWRRWELAWAAIAVGLVAYLCTRPRARHLLVLWALVGWQFLVDMMVYVLNPYEIHWTLSASLVRLLLQLMPLAFVAAAASLLLGRPPPPCGSQACPP
jgi:hypothetical protein